MRDWNAVITVREGGFAPACRLLEPFGPVRKTEFFNTLAMRAEDPFRLLANLQGELSANPTIAAWISRFMPIRQLFTFQTVAEFELRSQEAVLAWLPLLGDTRLDSYSIISNLPWAMSSRFLSMPAGGSRKAGLSSGFSSMALV